MAGSVRFEPATQYRSFHRIMIFPASGGPAFPEKRVCGREASTLFLLPLSSTLQCQFLTLNLVLT
jgi:hypothetical protein